MAISTVSLPEIGYSIASFQLKFPGTRVSAENGNIELYSLNGSFERENVLWEIVITSSTTSSTQQGAVTEIRGFVFKKQSTVDPTGRINWNRLFFVESEAKLALTCTFLNAFPDVRVNGIAPPNPEPIIPPFSSREIMFTLRSRNVTEPTFLAQYQNRVIEISPANNYAIATGAIISRTDVTNVHGVLYLLNPVSSLEECATILATIFPKQLIVWMTYCTNYKRYSNGCNIPIPQSVINDVSRNI